MDYELALRQEATALRARAERAEAEAALLRQALEEVEYVEEEEGESDTRYCPWCLTFRYKEGHASTCSRQMALGKA